MRIPALFLVLLFVISSAVASEINDQTSSNEKQWPKENKLLLANIASLAVIGSWGLMTWEYGTHDSHVQPDNWFRAHTKHGGADKIGHSYATYALSQAFSHAYESWGYTHQQAASYGTLSGLGMHLFVEFGDSFSSFGFSAEDMLMNTVGAAAAWVRYYYPRVGEVFDYRVEYIPTFTQYDFFTDYDGLKYVVALKLAAFKPFQNNWSRYLELQGGFYARGYENNDTLHSRNVYAAIGINLSEIVRRHTSMRKTATLLNYVQMPYAYLPYTRSWDHYEP